MGVSSDPDRQTTDLQRDALLSAGVDSRHLFEDHASGAKDDRCGLAKALEFVKSSDVLVVWKLDRLGRSLSHLLSIVNELKDKQVASKCCNTSAQPLPRTMGKPGPLWWRLYAGECLRNSSQKESLSSRSSLHWVKSSRAPLFKRPGCAALAETRYIMGRIDQTIEVHGGWPLTKTK